METESTFVTYSFNFAVVLLIKAGIYTDAF